MVYGYVHVLRVELSRSKVGLGKIVFGHGWNSLFFGANSSDSPAIDSLMRYKTVPCTASIRNVTESTQSCSLVWTRPPRQNMYGGVLRRAQIAYLNYVSRRSHAMCVCVCLHVCLFQL